MYLTYDAAELACNSDPVCKYIYDTECNKLNKFNLCDENADVKTSTASCIYKKTTAEKLGKHIEYSWGPWFLILWKLIWDDLRNLFYVLGDITDDVTCSNKPCGKFCYSGGEAGQCSSNGTCIHTVSDLESLKCDEG